MNEHEWLAERFEAHRTTITDGKIVAIDIVADPASLRQSDLTILDD